MRTLVLCLLALVSTSACSAAPPATGAVAAPPVPAAERGPLGAPVLHVPSPDWRDQVLYFVMTDRFDDGDARNNDQGAGEYDPADTAKYNGGDLAGLQRRLDYIQGLGATGVWITPPVRQRWWDPVAQHGGYHGYWARDFSAMDPHVGTLAELQGLSRALHGRGMVLVQDIVLNHVADYFDYDASWSAGAPARGWRATPESDGATAPTQAPFDRNDPRRAADRAAGIYHWTPRIRDFQDPAQLHDWQMSGLDDLNSENPEVRRALRQAYGDWIRRAGVDGFRVDTAFYVPNPALEDFLHARDARAPGVLAVARGTGRAAFHVFGEGFAIDKPYEDVQAARIDGLMRRADGGPLLPGMLNFPLYADAGAVFARGAPTAQLAHRIEATMRLHADPWRMVSFLDNHDVDRFLAGGDEAGLQQGLLMLFTLPGIPTLYYGTEQGLRGQRAAMFGKAQGSDGRDRFDTQAPLYRQIAALATLRREHRLFSRGRPTLLQSLAAGPGVLAYRMDGEGASALALFNTADHPVLADNLDLGRAHARLRGLFALDGEAPALRAGVDGRVTLQLPPRAGYAWMIEGPDPLALVAPPPPALTLAPVDGAPAGTFEGRAPGRAQVQLVVDGDLSHVRRVPVARDGRWRATVDGDAMVDPRIAHRVVAWSPDDNAVSPAQSLKLERAFVPVAAQDDPPGDDRGPAGRYVYPTDWHTPTLDIRRVRAEVAGGALRLHVTMGALSTAWNPPNGFDHVAFNVFIALPGVEGGARVLPFQHAAWPGAGRWQVRLRAHGWSNALFGSEGAGPQADGTPLAPAAAIAVDRASNTVSFTFSPRVLGGRASLSGARVYVATWDYDGGYRSLQPRPGGSILGGGDGARDPLVMDDALLELP